MSDQPDEDAPVAPGTVKYRRNLAPRPPIFVRPTGVTVAAPDPDRKPDQDFLERQALAAGPDNAKRTDPPRWFVEEVEKGSDAEEIIRVLRKRVPHQSDLREAVRILNEIGRLRGGGRLLRKVVTQRLLAELATDVR